MSVAAAASLKKIVPLLDRIVVKKLKPIDKTASGIFIPEKAQEALNRGVVVAVGPGSKDFSMSLKEGDSVLLPGYGGTIVKCGEDEMHIFREADILARYEP